MMGVPAQLCEATRDLVVTHIKANIGQALADVRANWPDQSVTTEPPRVYFIYDGANTFQCPAVFTVVDNMDFPEDVLNPNHINAIVRLFVSIVVEDREAKLLTIKCERYQAALFQTLHRIQIADPVKNLKIYSRVLRASFSPLYTKKPRQGEGSFRKEASMELEIKHWENPTLY